MVDGVDVLYSRLKIPIDMKTGQDQPTLIRKQEKWIIIFLKLDG